MMDAMEVKLQTLPKQVAGVLARRIASSGVAGGQGPSEQQILQEFGVSRAVAREALKILASLDMIEIAQGRRVVLRPADEWDYLSPLLIDWLPPEQTREILAEAHATRIIIEPAITAIAAKHMTKENLERLGTLLAAMSASEDNADAYLKLDLDFHMEICRAAKNRILDRFMYSSRWWQMASRRISNQVPHALPSATEMHRAIYEALVARDAKRAGEAMRRHLKITTAVGLPP
ncbi:FadR family transcriptional regulator [Mesorhizobium sp. B2-4-1]|uniref:FadR/GntR family transcriptional regulator n=3 Tax=unclassified Mesorhizobium TaxID=325217 RepID=UPI0011296D10|nr:FCD domain-containing protein [Mesorhizobium sp. BR-1-1-8]MBZ9983289.1 FCD domain-containing protein [Mesorhizobium sp. BR-1-1-8]TPL32710.1 FadR family transcriptional regulator [Mesorhizobium sp. B2-4-8]TPL62213.1 FadR family transcriptional regulator [Mesorhizobium sp. B2-4-1]